MATFSAHRAVAGAQKLAFAALASALASAAIVSARLDFNLTQSLACTPLNISFVPENDGYPYTVWIGGVLQAVSSFRIDRNFQPNTSPITFQYDVPSSGLGSYIVTVADNKGNGNSSRPMTVNQSSRSGCDPYLPQPQWFWAGDNQNNTNLLSMTQCGITRFYNTDQRGTRPFTITYIPIQGEPMTIEVPNSAVNGQSNFIYNVTTPYKAGTQLYVVLGDSFGGASGGGSQLYTVLDSDDTSCLFPTYTVPNLGNLALPTASQTATFNNEKGAVATGVPSSTSGAPTSTSSNGSSNRGGGGGGGASVGAITGGVIGGAIAVAVIVAAAIFFLVIRRRRQKQREAARKEDAHFVDLDGDEDDAAGAFGARRNRRGSAHLGQGVQQTYEVSPFQYHPMHQESPEPVQSPYLDNPASRPGSIAASQRESGYGLSQYPPDPARQGAAAPSMLHSSYVQAPDATANNGDNILALGHSTSSSTGDSAGNGAQAYRLQTRNEAPALPRKAPLPGDEEAQGSSTPRRLVVHSDGGPLPQPVSDDEEDYTELPPQYGGWARQQQAETETTPQTQTQPQPPREQ